MNRSFCAACVACLILLAVVGPARAADTPDEGDRFTLPDPSFLPTSFDERPHWRKNLFKRVLSDQKFLVTTWWPAESRRYDFSIPLVLAVAGASGSSRRGVDLAWQRNIEAWTAGGRREVADVFTLLGDRDTGVLLLGASYLVSRWAGNVRMQRTTSLASEALLNSALYTSVLKKLTRRTRPASAGVGEFFVVSPMGGQETSSFPSGHASGAFAVATAFAWEFRDKRWAPWLAYGTASLISVSRVGLGRHFPSDILAGAVLGRSIGRMVVQRNGGEERSRPWNRLEPIYEPRNNGFGLGYRHVW